MDWQRGWVMRWLWVMWLLMACSGSQGEGGPAEHPSPRRVARKATPVNASSTLSVSNIEGSFGPYRALAGDRALLLWAAPTEGGRTWFSLLTDLAGRPRTRPLQLTHAPAEVGLARERATARGFVAVISARGAHGPTVESLALGDGGQLQGGALLTRPAGEVVWLDVFPLTDRALVAWAALGASGHADVFVASLSLHGALLSQPQLVAKAVTAWQGVALEDEVAIATVTPGNAAGAAAARGIVELTFVGRTGVASPRVELSNAADAQPEIDLARVGDKLICAWSEWSEHRTRIRAAVVDAQGRIALAAKSVAPGVSDQALVRLLSRPNAAHAYLMWESLSPNIGTPREFRLSRLDAAAANLGPILDVRYDADQGVPELETSNNGVVLVTQISDCSPPCEQASTAAYYSRLAEDLRVLGSGKVEISAPQQLAPDGLWATECSGECSALAALKETPARIFTVAFPSNGSASLGLVTLTDDSSRPRVRDIEVLAETEPLAKVAAVTTARGPLVAWITDFDPNTLESAPRVAPDGQKRPMQAWLQTRLLDPKGAVSTVETVSYRARSLGGVTLAHDPKTQNTLLVWAALDQNKPHVFVTLLDATGKKLKQRMLTRSPGEVYDTAAVVANDGFIVAWVDARSGAPRAYATKVDMQLARQMPDTALSSGVVSGLALDISDNQLWLAYAESDDALASEALYALRLDEDLRGVGAPMRVSTGRRHAHSPELARRAAGIQVVWLEDDSEELDALTHVMSAHLTSSGNSALSEARAVELDLGGFSASSATVSCRETDCRTVVAGRAGSQRAVLLSGSVGPRPSPLRVLAELDATGLLAAATLLDSTIFMGDVGRGGRNLVKRFEVDW